MNAPIELSPDILQLAEELKIDEKDIEEHFIKGGGPGGQKINKTASAVQLKHLPSGIEVTVQRYREQSKNRKSAWKSLILKIEEQEKGEESRAAKQAFKIRKQKQRRSRRAKEKMLDEKKKLSDVKELRRNAWNAWRNEEL